MAGGFVKITTDPEVLKDPVVEGQRVGKLFWKHTVLLEVKYNSAMMNYQPTTMLSFREECESMMKGTFKIFAEREAGEDSEHNQKKLLFWRTIREHYKE